MSRYDLISRDEYLAHHGIKGQKWGIRRYQNSDGSLTEFGKKHYSSDSSRFEKSYRKAIKRASAVSYRAKRLRRATHKPRFLMEDEVVANREHKLNKSKNRYERSLRKADRLYRRMERRYSNSSMANLNSDTIGKGRDIAARLSALEMTF